MTTVDRRGVSVDATDTAIAGNPNPGLAIKAPCLVATTGNITLSGLQTIDGVALAAGNRVLVWQQTDTTLNGLYNPSSGTWTRTIDANSNDQWASGLLVDVSSGTTLARNIFQLQASDPIALSTTHLVFVPISPVPASRRVDTTAPLAGGGALAADLTLSITIGATLAVVSNTLRTVAMTGDVTASANSFATTIANAAVTYAKIQNVAASRLLGNPTGGATSASEISLGATLAFSGTAMRTAAGTGDVTWSANSFATTVAKINGVLLGSTTATAGNLLVGSGAQWVSVAVSGDGTLSSAGALAVTKTNGTSFTTNATAAVGQLPGTTTNDDAASGKVGEFITSQGTNGTSTVTITNASPGVVTWASHGLNIASPVNFTTTGGLPTGLSVGTNYYVSSQGFAAGAFSVSTTVANALAGTSVNTSSAGSGTHTALSNVILATGVAVNVTGISLTAGDWDVRVNGAFGGGATTTVNFIQASSSQVSGSLPGTPGPTLNTTICYGQTPFNFAGHFVLNVGPARFSLSGTTTVFLVANASFGTSTAYGYGTISARRRR